jgi:hypothetical protein
VPERLRDLAAIVLPIGELRVAALLLPAGPARLG